MMTKIILLIVGLVGLVGVGRAQILQNGQCGTINYMQNFVLNSFATGTWYEVGKATTQNADCSNLQFTTTGTTISVTNSSVVNNFLQTATGTATHTAGTAQLTLTLSNSANPIEFNILGSDYNNYAIAINCVNSGTTQRTVNVWQLGRSVNSYDTPAILTAANNSLSGIGLSVNDLTIIDHSTAACTQLPVIGAGQPVILPGQCANPSIPVVQNFDVQRFTGTWHEISSYYSANAVGTCARANYDLVGGVVNVVNSQILNQRLDTITGTATLIGTDQSGRLSVTLDVLGVPINQELLILGTDYTGYAVSYSCFNLPNNQRQVTSWILSRTRQISTQLQTEVNRIIDSLVDLNTAYYIPTDQSDNGCFYYPTHQPGVPVQFPGQCDNAVAAVPNFNLAQFNGTWHEVEAYPKEQQTGTCVNHVFSPGINTASLNLISNQVINQFLTSANGSVTLDSNDGSGRLILRLIVSGQIDIEMPFWILATDYSSYALAYSCMYLNNGYRAVSSWKLSRTQSLPAAANTPINNAMAAVQVLDQQYFESVNQTAAGCFAYPEIPAGQPVILPGSCATVTPIANFQYAAFTGTWHELARYPSARQSGNCATSQYTSSAPNTFTLRQTIVYNERQTVVTGTATLAPGGSGTFTANLSDGANLTYTTTIHILDTDYTEFAVLHSCQDLPGTNNRQIFSWKLSRSTAGFSQAANNRISQVVANNQELLERYYQTIGHTAVDCFHYPVFVETPESIILPGSCPAVSGVANFNPLNYVGQWYDVARYPIASQFGSCPRAEYSLVDGVVTIRNTMVVNETLREQNGIARLSATGTGLLQVTFVLENGVESVAQYYILGTDYTSYSLVYNCRNLADGTRQVSSWKLSRTPTLTTAANIAINNIISNTQGLLEDYYQNQSHTNQDCFYVPELVPGESVIFTGGCEQVTGMQGFNPSQYLGWWHEIERYPSEGVSGQCSSSNFVQATTNSIQVIESEVYNGVANETTNVAVLSANGTITITRAGVTSTYIVIATDYNTYSLLYTCEEVLGSSGTQRRVWSAKHSKARSLTAAAQAAMAPHIASNPVLHQHLYESVNQSHSACFHYREDNNEQVILPGQCDTNIPVQPNFNLSRFAGTWYQIERYPYPQVSNNGTCVGARYTETGGTITVLNWEVLGGVLNTIEGTATVNGAILSVTLPGEGNGTVTTNIHILLTDYDDHALAYTCVNINAFQRTVGAFKLSRNRQLSNAGQSAIGTYMATREELHQPYFINVSQHDDCEEPSSAFIFKSSIIVMLVCIVLQIVM